MESDYNILLPPVVTKPDTKFALPRNSGKIEIRSRIAWVQGHNLFSVTSRSVTDNFTNFYTS